MQPFQYSCIMLNYPKPYVLLVQITVASGYSSLPYWQERQDRANG